MSMGASRARLAAAMKQLRVHWDLVKAKWDDPVRAEFDRKFLQTLEPKIRAAATATTGCSSASAGRRRC